ncbi:hypothetical protein DXG03_001771, partial [Asterophora parasitica]
MHELVMTKVDEAVPEGLVDQQSNLEDLEGRRKKLEDIIAGLPESGPGVDELRAKSEWDLSKLKDLLKKLGDAVGDKLAALAAWNALRKGAEAELVDLTKEKPVPKDAAGLEKNVEDLTNDERALEALAQNARDGVNPDDLDDDEKKKRDDLINQIEKALALIKARKAAAEKALKDAQDSDKLAADLAKIDSRLAPLVEEATRLLQDPDAIPSAYTSTAKDLKAATDEARPIVDAARSSKDPAVKTLAATVTEAEHLVPQLEDRSKTWDDFVAARDAADQQLDQLRKPLEEQLAKKKLRSLPAATADLEAAADALEKLAPLQDTIAALQRLSEQLDPLESAYADVRFFDVDVEQTNKQAEDLVNDLNAEIQDEQALTDSTAQMADEFARLGELIASAPGKENLETIRDHQLPAVEAQLESLEDKSRAAKNAPRKFVDRDSAPLESLSPLLKECKQKLAESLKKAEDEDKDKFILAIALQLQKLAEETPIDSVPLEKIDDLEKQLTGVDSPAARDQLEAIKKLRKKRAENDHLRDKVLDAVEKAKDATKKIDDDVKSSSPDSAAKGKKGKKSKKDDSSPGVEAPLADQIAALEKHVRDINESILPSIDSALALPVDAPAEKKDAEKARQNAQDLAARLTDDINNKKVELDNQNKARSVEDALAKIGDKLESIIAPYSDKPQSLTKAESDVQKIADLLAKDLAAVPIDQLADPSSAAATAAKLKQKAKERVAPLEKEIDAEKKLATDSDAFEAQAAHLEKDLDSVRNKTDDPAAAIATIADIADRAR